MATTKTNKTHNFFEAFKKHFPGNSVLKMRRRMLNGEFNKELKCLK